MSCSHAAASSSLASAPRTGARLRARAATPWTCAQRRGRGSCRSAWASCCAYDASVFILARLGSCDGTFTGLAALLSVLERVPGVENPSALGVRAELAFWTGRSGDAAAALATRSAATRLHLARALSAVYNSSAEPGSEERAIGPPSG